MFEIVNRAQKGAVYLLKIAEENIPANPNTAFVFFETNRNVPAWWDGDNVEFVTFKDPGDIPTSTITVSNTTTETEIYRADVDTGSLIQNRQFKISVFGKYTTAASSDDVRFRVKVGPSGFDAVTGGTELANVVTVQANVNDAPFDIETTFTIYSDGSSGQAVSYSKASFDSTPNNDSKDPFSIDTTVVEEFVVTAEWTNAKAGNTLVRQQASIEQAA